MKTETKHTPGPWEVHGLAIYEASKWKDGIDYGSRFVAQGQDDDDVEPNEAIANARLIAAAPELLEALQDVLRYCVTVKGMPDKDKGRTDEQQAAYDKARAAIAKAVNQ